MERRKERRERIGGCPGVARQGSSARHPCPVPALARWLSPAPGTSHLGGKPPALPDLHVSGALTRKAARLPAAAAPRWDKGSLQPVLQLRAREQGASERRQEQPPDAARSAVPTRLSVPTVERVFLTSLMTPQPLQRTNP